MAGIYDVHAHLNDNRFIDEEVTSSEIVEDSKKSGVSFINNVGYDIKSSKLAVQQATKNKHVYAIVGIHPTQAYLYSTDAIKEIEEMTYANKVVAIGEIGLDYHTKSKDTAKQKEFFEAQLDLAVKRNLPVMLHVEDEKGSNKAYEDALKILQSKKIKHAVLHSFTGDLKIAEEYIKAGYFISISGEITREKELEAVISKISLSNLMVESDAPYKIPKPYKTGKMNHPKYMNLIINEIAKIKKMSAEEVVSATGENAQKFFGIK